MAMVGRHGGLYRYVSVVVVVVGEMRNELEVYQIELHKATGSNRVRIEYWTTKGL
jgi:hypothetical protein